MAIAQDRAGYLWLGTAEGLVRFDGVNFTAFTSSNTAGFRHHFVGNLHVDRRGALWIGTQKGQLLSWERGEMKHHPLEPQASGMSYNCLAEDGAGTLWIGTYAGLFYRPAGHDSPIQPHRGFSGTKIFCLATDRSGRLLVSTIHKGLYRLEKERARRILLDGDSLGDDIDVIREDYEGSLWLGTISGLYRLQNGRLFRYPLQPGMTDHIMALVEDRDGNLWVGTEGGLCRLHRGVGQYLDATRGLSGNYVYALHEDTEGSLWAGIVDGGLVQIRDEKITTFTDREGLKGEVFRSVHGDGGGGLWIGGYGGHLSRFLGNRFENFALPARFRNESVWSLAADGDGRFWLGTSRGLVRCQDGLFEEFPMPPPAARMETRCVLKDRSNRLWIGTYGAGLFCRHRGTIQRISMTDGLRDDRITCLFSDRAGTVWIGSESGLNSLVAGALGAMVVEPPLNGCRVESMYEDDHGVLWVGTRNHGLMVKRGGRWGSLSSERGLFDNRIYTIIEDGLGYVWMSSERGIFRARRIDLEKAALDPSLHVRGRLFDENDGLKSRICNNGHPAAWKTADGRLWFATVKGLAVVDPARLQPNPQAPRIRLEEVVIDHRRLNSSGDSTASPVKLAAGSRRFEFKYTALSFVHSDKIEFKYKLDGYDGEWIPAGNRRQAFYNNLRPGRYRFRVIAANADGVWNSAGASFAFTLRPFVYQTGWFLALAALAFAALSGGAWQLLRKYLRAVSFVKKKTHIGHFKILETIGSGGMATIYKAQDMLDKRRVVALKVLSDENFANEAQRKRFKHESLITEQLDHPHVVHIFERGEMAECCYIAMELLPGVSLARLIREGGRLRPGAALDIMRQIVDALSAIHAKEIVHRDLKPENIMVCEREGRRHFVKLLDFGLAITPAQSRLTVSGVVMGTIRYLPPERILDGVSSRAGDIYSAGIILYEMVTGSKPFWSEATGEVIHRILETDPLPAREIDPGIPRELEALIQAMIAKDPERRPRLETIADELQRLTDRFAPDGREREKERRERQ
ncbi:MAG: protein kinase [Candidatus Aminicenantes bacterium]|nr:protein kinase [Candidatus Aminicenantes bacterium]